MANDVFVGPVNYVVFALPPTAAVGAGLASIMQCVDTGIVEILDIECITCDAAGVPTACALTEIEGVTEFDLSVFDGAISHLLDTDDLAAIAEDLETGWMAIAIVYEDRTFANVGAEWARVGGTELVSGGIDVQQLEAAVE